jgi:pimeloyl-ACP methyl ester carboxylesterase
MAALLARALPSDPIRTVPGAGHMLPATHADELAALLEAYWAR